MDADGALQGRHVLVVEDVYLLAAELEHVLRLAGARDVTMVPSLADAMKIIESDHIDLAVLDIEVDGGSIYSVADALVERRAPFVFVTGYDRRVLPDRFIGVTLHQKPCIGPELISSIKQMLPAKLANDRVACPPPAIEGRFCRGEGTACVKLYGS